MVYKDSYWEKVSCCWKASLFWLSLLFASINLSIELSVWCFVLKIVCTSSLAKKKITKSSHDIAIIFGLCWNLQQFMAIAVDLQNRKEEEENIYHKFNDRIKTRLNKKKMKWMWKKIDWAIESTAKPNQMERIACVIKSFQLTLVSRAFLSFCSGFFVLV